MALSMDIPPIGPALFTDQGEWRCESPALASLLNELVAGFRADTPSWYPDLTTALITAITTLIPEARVIRRDTAEEEVKGRVY